MRPTGDDMTEIELCCHRTEALWVTVWAEIKDGKLTVSGQDLGQPVKEWFGSDEFEYPALRTRSMASRGCSLSSMHRHTTFGRLLRGYGSFLKRNMLLRDIR